MGNHANINGDNNNIVQDVKNSTVNINKKQKTQKTMKIVAMIGLLIAAATLIITVLIGWDNLLKFFNHGQ